MSIKMLEIINRVIYYYPLIASIYLSSTLLYDIYVNNYNINLGICTCMIYISGYLIKYNANIINNKLCKNIVLFTSFLETIISVHTLCIYTYLNELYITNINIILNAISNLLALNLTLLLLTFVFVNFREHVFVQHLIGVLANNFRRTYNESDVDKQLPEELIYPFIKIHNFSEYTDKIYHFDECSICKINYSSEDAILEINNCKHYYHKNCVIGWLKTHKNCPLCSKLFYK